MTDPRDLDPFAAKDLGEAPPPHQLDAIIHRTFDLQSATPDPDDVLRLYLELPRVFLNRTVPMKARSSFEAAYTDTSIAHQHEIRWLAAIGALAFFDEIGTAVKLRTFPNPGCSPVEYTLRAFGGLSEPDAAALYALRCALAHDYSLINPNDSKPNLRHAFSLGFSGTPKPVVTLPAVGWDGAMTGGSTTGVDLRALMAKFDEVHDQVIAEYHAGSLALGRPADEMRRRYFFQHPVDVAEWDRQQEDEGVFESYGGQSDES